MSVKVTEPCVEAITLNTKNAGGGLDHEVG